MSKMAKPELPYYHDRYYDSVLRLFYTCIRLSGAKTSEAQCWIRQPMTCMASVVARNQTEVSASFSRLLLSLSCAGNAERIQTQSTHTHTNTCSIRLCASCSRSCGRWRHARFDATWPGLFLHFLFGGFFLPAAPALGHPSHSAKNTWNTARPVTSHKAASCQRSFLNPQNLRAFESRRCAFASSDSRLSESFFFLASGFRAMTSMVAA